MKKNLLLFCCSLVFLSSCIKDEQSCEEIVVHKHSMDEVRDKEILWKDIFSRDELKYYVYCYGPTCPHCKKIENEIIEFAFANNITYFCKILNDFEYYSSFSDNTIGINNVEYLTIVGTPTLIEIENGYVKQNISGDNDILVLLNNFFQSCK